MPVRPFVRLYLRLGNLRCYRCRHAPASRAVHALTHLWILDDRILNAEPVKHRCTIICDLAPDVKSMERFAQARWKAQETKRGPWRK